MLNQGKYLELNNKGLSMGKLIISSFVGSLAGTVIGINLNKQIAKNRKSNVIGMGIKLDSGEIPHYKGEKVGSAVGTSSRLGNNKGLVPIYDRSSGALVGTIVGSKEGEMEENARMLNQGKYLELNNKGLSMGKLIIGSFVGSLVGTVIGINHNKQIAKNRKGNVLGMGIKLDSGEISPYKGGKIGSTVGTSSRLGKKEGVVTDDQGTGTLTGTIVGSKEGEIGV